VQCGSQLGCTDRRSPWPHVVTDDVTLPAQGIEEREAMMVVSSDVSGDRAPEVRAALEAHSRATSVNDSELLDQLRAAATGSTEALAWVRAREREHAAAARAFRDIERAAGRADLIAVADAAPIVGLDLVTLMRRIETRGLAYVIPAGRAPGPRGRLYIRRE